MIKRRGQASIKIIIAAAIGLIVIVAAIALVGNKIDAFKLWLRIRGGDIEKACTHASIGGTCMTVTGCGNVAGKRIIASQACPRGLVCCK